MNVRFKLFVPSSFLALAALLASGSQAKADFEIKIIDTTPGCTGTCSFTIVDNGAGDLDATTGGIIFSGSNVDFTTDLTTGTSKPILPQAQLALNSLNVTSSKANTSLMIEISDTGFTGPTGLQSLSEQLSMTSLTGGIITSVTGYESNTNADFATTNPTATVSLSAPASGVTGSGGPYLLAAPFSLTEIVNISFASANAQAQITANLSTVPEPASAALLGGILLATCTALRRKFRRV